MLVALSLSAGGLVGCFGGRAELLEDVAPYCVDPAGFVYPCGAPVATASAVAEAEAPAPERLPRRRATSAVVISMDGLGARQLALALTSEGLPTFERLAAMGASTLAARTDPSVTVTLPNHVSMLTGRPVAAVVGLPPDTHHGYLGNTLPGVDETLHNAGNPALAYVPSLFDVAHDRGYRTCLFTGKPKFELFARSYDAGNGAPDATGKDDGSAKLDRFVVLEDRSLLEVAGEAIAAGACELSLLHIADLDRIGHQSAWDSATWRQALVELDQALGLLLERLEAAERLDELGLILTADHGGVGRDHADPTLPEIYEIPFFLVGPGVPGGSDLYSLTLGRRLDPGEEQPGDESPTRPIRNGDSGNLALEMLGLPPIPGSLFRDLGLGG